MRKFGEEKVSPLVSAMDEGSYLDEGILKGLFENGVSLLGSIAIRKLFTIFDLLKKVATIC